MSATDNAFQPLFPAQPWEAESLPLHNAPDKWSNPIPSVQGTMEGADVWRQVRPPAPSAPQSLPMNATTECDLAIMANDPSRAATGVNAIAPDLHQDLKAVRNEKESIRAFDL